MIVGDASVLVALLINDQPTASRVWNRIGARTINAPHLLDLEVVNAVRRGERRGELDAGAAEAAIQDLRLLAVARHPHEPFLSRAWALRENLTAYDASYVALAEALDAPLFTTDRAIAQAPGVACDVELFG